LSGANSPVDMNNMEPHREQPYILKGTKAFVVRNKFESYGNNLID
jgi:hypothetical protein